MVNPAYQVSYVGLPVAAMFWGHLDCNFKNYFSCCYDNIPDQNNLKKGLFHHLGEGVAQKPEVSGHMVPTVRKQGEMSVRTQLASSYLFSPGPSWTLPPTFKVGRVRPPPPSYTSLETPSQTQRSVF